MFLSSTAWLCGVDDVTLVYWPIAFRRAAECVFKIAGLHVVFGKALSLQEQQQQRTMKCSSLAPKTVFGQQSYGLKSENYLVKHGIVTCALS